MRRFILISLLMIAGLTAADRTGIHLLKESDAFLKSPEGIDQLANLLSYQTPTGGWCKAYDVRKPRDASAGADGFGGWHGTPTIDNGATYSEIRVLARSFVLTGMASHQQACLRGLTFLLERQYPNGGWPQRSPLEPGDHSYGIHITYNDHAMTEVMALMRDIAEGGAPFSWATEAQRLAASAAFDRGVDCLLRSQITVAGTLTAWCQQHDSMTLAPVAARAYELPCLASSESARITLLLMQIEKPDERVRRAVDAAHAWFERSRIDGKKIVEQDNDRVLIDDRDAPPLWARCYDLDTNRPFFCDRDGVQRWALSEISRERRTGYAWYGTWGEKVLREHPKWLVQVGASPTP